MTEVTAFVHHLTSMLAAKRERRQRESRREKRALCFWCTQRCRSVASLHRVVQDRHFLSPELQPKSLWAQSASPTSRLSYQTCHNSTEHKTCTLTTHRTLHTACTLDIKIPRKRQWREIKRWEGVWNTTTMKYLWRGASQPSCKGLGFVQHSDHSCLNMSARLAKLVRLASEMLPRSCTALARHETTPPAPLSFLTLLRPSHQHCFGWVSPLLFHLLPPSGFIYIALYFYADGVYSSALKKHWMKDAGGGYGSLGEMKGSAGVEGLGLLLTDSHGIKWNKTIWGSLKPSPPHRHLSTFQNRQKIFSQDHSICN